MLEYSEGSEESFRKLYSFSFPWVYGYFAKRARNKEWAEELTQMAYLKLHRAKEKYDPKFPFKHWMFVICRNTWIDFTRSNKISMNSESTDFDQWIAPQEDNQNSSRTTADILNPTTMDQLTENQRKSIELKFISEKSYEEISEILGATESTVRQWISRGLQKIKKSQKALT